MSKELPFFKFYVDDWLLGKIMSLPPAIQGRFITFCARYWRRNCEVSTRFYNKSLPKTSKNLLESEGIVKVNNGTISIQFLDEQFTELTEKHILRVQAGSRGGKAKALAMLEKGYKQKGSIIDVEVDVEVDKEKKYKKRKSEFIEDVLILDAPERLKKEFIEYWTATNKGSFKMAYEKCKTFSIPHRMGTWQKNDKNYSKPATHKSAAYKPLN